MVLHVCGLIEKTYVEELTNYCRDMFPFWKEKIKKFLRRLFKYDLEIEDEKKNNYKNSDSDEEEYILEENEEEEEEEEEKKEENKEEENKKEDEKKEDKKNTKEVIKIDDDINENDNNRTLKKIKSLKNNNLNNEKNEEDKKNNDTNLNETKEDDNKNIEIIEKYFDRFKGFASDLLSYFYSIPFYFTLWMNYSETHIYENYDVTMENFIYFYYFSFISIFFTITYDIILYNLLHVYSHINLHDFLDYMRYRYYVRPKNWCLDDMSNNPELEFQSRKMFKLCFSSQYYFLKTCYMNSLMYTLIGIISLMLNNINPFVDQDTPFIFILVYFTSKLIHFITSYIFLKFKFWAIEEEEVKSNEEEETIEEKPKKEIIIKPIAFSRESWEKIRNLKKQNNILKENLKTERFLLEATKKQFVNNNRKYLQNHIGNIITEKLLIKYKEKIISVLKKIFNDKIKSDFCENKLNIEDIKFYSPHKQKDSESNSESNYSNEFRTEYISNFKEKKYFYEILSIWKKRAQLNIYLKNQIKLIIIDMKREKCDKCGKKINLKSFFYGDIINVFFNFIHKTNTDLNNFDIINFKMYIKNNSKNYIKTLCLNCC